MRGVDAVIADRPLQRCGRCPWRSRHRL